MKKYVAGLMFSEDRTKVALIRKNKPDWQKGLLNGIGGKIEDEDFSLYYSGDKNKMTSEAAMIREFEEETGVSTKRKDWNHFLTMKSESSGNLSGTQQYDEMWSVDFYRCFSDKVFECKTMEDEKVEIHDITALMFNYDNTDVADNKTIGNLKWIILLALDKNPKFTTTNY